MLVFDMLQLVCDADMLLAFGRLRRCKMQLGCYPLMSFVSYALNIMMLEVVRSAVDTQCRSAVGVRSRLELYTLLTDMTMACSWNWMQLE